MRGLKINPWVFFPSAGIIVLFVLLGAMFPEGMGERVGQVQNFIVTQFGWFYIIAVGFFLIFTLWLLISRYGGVKLGKDDDEPDYNLFTWFAMLFSAGMGIGLLFFSVAEPMLHYLTPPHADPASVEAARDAMTISIFHWGLHAWAIYIVVGLALAYFAYRHDLPLTIRSTLYPLLGDRIYGPIGNAVDVMAIFGTLFGVATSLGIGVQQINAGLDYLGIFEANRTNQIILITVITLAATVSVVTGIDRGIRRLSELNLALGFALLIFVFIAGPTLFLLGSFVQSIGGYISALPELTFRTDAFVGPDWQKSWTMFYWGWWISWSPFVGMFIARVSRGRTIREFILGVLFAPTLLALAWMVVFGNTAINLQMQSAEPTAVAVAVGSAETLPQALYMMLEELPWSAISATLATLVIATYFVTSSDSASLVIDILSSDGDPDPPIPQRVFWALTEGAVAAVLLLAGGLAALQTAAITTALPFSIIMFFICWSLVRGLSRERLLPGGAIAYPLPPGGVEGAAGGAAPPEMAPARRQPWRERLNYIIMHKSPLGARVDVKAARANIRDFIDDTVLPAFQDIKTELEKHGRTAKINRDDYQAAIVVMKNGDEEFSYAVRGRAYHKMSFAFPDMGRSADGKTVNRGEVVLRHGRGRDARVDRWTREGIIQDFLDEYARWVGW